jgi:hypothetical protein
MSREATLLVKQPLGSHMGAGQTRTDHANVSRFGVPIARKLSRAFDARRRSNAVSLPPLLYAISTGTSWHVIFWAFT